MSVSSKFHRFVSLCLTILGENPAEDKKVSNESFSFSASFLSKPAPIVNSYSSLTSICPERISFFL